MCQTNPCITPNGMRSDTKNALGIARAGCGHDFETFAFSGVIDARAGQLLDGLPDLVQSGTVEFDFGNIKRINSMGIALLLRCFKRIKEERGTELQVRNLNQVNAMLFKMTGVFQLVKWCDEPSLE